MFLHPSEQKVFEKHPLFPLFKGWVTCLFQIHFLAIREYFRFFIGTLFWVCGAVLVAIPSFLPALASRHLKTCCYPQTARGGDLGDCRDPLSAVNLYYTPQKCYTSGPEVIFAYTGSALFFFMALWWAKGKEGKEAFRKEAARIIRIIERKVQSQMQIYTDSSDEHTKRKRALEPVIIDVMKQEARMEWLIFNFESFLFGWLYEGIGVPYMKYVHRLLLLGKKCTE